MKRFRDSCLGTALAVRLFTDPSTMGRLRLTHSAVACPLLAALTYYFSPLSGAKISFIHSAFAAPKQSPFALKCDFSLDFLIMRHGNNDSNNHTKYTYLRIAYCALRIVPPWKSPPCTEDTGPVAGPGTEAEQREKLSRKSNPVKGSDSGQAGRCCRCSMGLGKLRRRN